MEEGISKLQKVISIQKEIILMDQEIIKTLEETLASYKEIILMDQQIIKTLEQNFSIPLFDKK